jgi:kinesin family protein 18/19
MCQMMMRSIRPPESKQATTLQVAVRCRPLSAKEKLKTRDILRVVDGKVVVVLDPDLSKEYLDRVQNRSKEKKYAFDVAFSPESTNEDVYNATVSSMVEGVVRGLNATIFAYGATGRCST